MAAENELAGADIDVLRSSFHAARDAAAAAPANAALALRLIALETEVAARELDVRVRYALARLADTDPRAGLTCYVSLSSDARRRVREVSGFPLLDELERLLDRRSDPNHAVTALLVFREAATIADSDPERALQQLVAHERALGRLGAATQLAVNLRQRIRDDRRRRLSDQLAAVRARLDAGDAAAALEILARVAPGEFDAGERVSIETLRAEAKLLLETHEMEASYERLLEGNDPLAARELAERLLARAADAEREHRRGQV